MRLILATIVATWLVLATVEAAVAERMVLALGDSLTAGYGLPDGQGWPELVRERLVAEGMDVNVVNAGVSGDTSAGGLARLDWLLSGLPEGAPEVAVVALGANDGLRGLPPEAMRRNLDTILTALDERGAKLLLAGMYAPRNLGPAYAADFDVVFPELAEKHGAVLYPFLLDGVALDPALNLPDGIHPNAQGQKIIAERLYPLIKELLESDG